MTGRPRSPKPADTNWQDRGACVGHPYPDLWFPVETDEFASALAKEVCAECPVVAECLEYALVTRQLAGVWGGHSEQELARIRRRRSRQKNLAVTLAAE